MPTNKAPTSSCAFSKNARAVATFGVVGRVALDGPAPEHCPEQVRRIHDEGHEVASHSMFHRFLPPLRRNDLLDDAATSRKVLEHRIDAPVRGFIPPFNRPMHFPQRRAFSVSELFGLHGRGRARQSLGSHAPRSDRGRAMAGRASASKTKSPRCSAAPDSRRDAVPPQPFLFEASSPSRCTRRASAKPPSALVRQYLRTDLTIAIYGHPNQALESNDQSAANLARFLDTFETERSHRCSNCIPWRRSNPSLALRPADE